MKKWIVFLCFVPYLAAAQVSWLHISPDKRHLVKEDGSVFFYLADTGWELFHRCNKQETEMYLKTRKAQGFTAIQAVILAELDGLNTPNAEGEKPFIDNNPLKPNEAYFKHVDWVIDKAAALGIYMAVLPTWGDKWNKKWGKGPVIFDTPEKARKYGKWLGERYRNRPNIIWVLGGDRNPEKEIHFRIIRAMAAGLREGDGGKHLITYHPSGSKSSSEWFQQDDWLDFNMAQTGHMRRNNPVYEMIGHDYRLTPVKPCLDGEPQYEDLPAAFNFNDERFVAFDAREAAWWSVLAGALGHTYGNNNIWQFWTPDRYPEIYARISWRYALRQPGAKQMGYLKKLFLSRDFLKLTPDQGVLAQVYGQDDHSIRAARGADSSYVIVYTPFGDPVHVKMEVMASDTVKGYWYNPREGSSVPLASFVNTGKVKVFVPPSSGVRTDWVLLLDDPARNYPDPGELEPKWYR